MSRRAVAVLGLVAMAGWSSGAADDDAAKAAKRIEGTYEVVSATRGGQPEPKAKDLKAFVIKDGTITIKMEKRDQTVKFTLDPSKKPAHIDMMPDDGKETIKGIYETKESDKGLELTLAFPRKDSGERPKDFKGTGDDDMVLKLLRKKAK